MLIDANLLIYAVDAGSRRHQATVDWLTARLNGPRRVGIPWSSLAAFLRITTHPRAFDRPLEPAEAWARVSDWLDAPAAWIPEPGPRHAELVGALIVRHRLRGNLIPDALLAALAIEHGLTLCSADAGFARFDQLRWQDPVG